MIDAGHTDADRLVAPPAIAQLSPIHEMLVLDVAEGSPWELREAIRSAATIGELNDWIAAGAMFRWVEMEPFLKRVYLDALGGDPRQAPLAVARVMAAQIGSAASRYRVARRRS